MFKIFLLRTIHIYHNDLVIPQYYKKIPYHLWNINTAQYYFAVLINCPRYSHYRMCYHWDLRPRNYFCMTACLPFLVRIVSSCRAQNNIQPLAIFHPMNSNICCQTKFHLVGQTYCTFPLSKPCNNSLPTYLISSSIQAGYKLLRTRSLMNWAWHT